MNNIRFHIFGVPDGFDIYQEVIDMENKSYYQCFYDESIKEQTRLAINRKPNGDVSYTYLKYHLYSNGNRPNAFIGLSVVFSNGYYADVSSLYNLLEQTYNSILQKGKLLYPIANGSSARFAVNKFSDDPLEIKRIESIVIGTLSTKSILLNMYHSMPHLRLVSKTLYLKYLFKSMIMKIKKRSKLSSCRKTKTILLVIIVS